MPHLFKDQAFVLKTTQYSESDLIVSLFTQEEGKINCIAKGARNSKRRFAGALDFGSFLEVVYEERFARELKFLKEVLPLPFSASWRQSFTTIAVAGYALELAWRLLSEHQKSSNKFFLLKEFLENLKEENAFADLLRWEYRWLSLSGWEPNLSRCGVCSLPVEEGESWQLLLERGELLCSQCQIGSAPLLSRGLLFWLKSARDSAEDGQEIGIKSGFKPLQDVFDLHWNKILGRAILARKLLDKALI